ncbi:type II secretion system F family protein, partial [Alistipes putredinis]|uniref:type II secretion system F family protein n=1 Tax=Alistipes putredinis TaxID=28117 RepID=UPI003A857974
MMKLNELLPSQKSSKQPLRDVRKEAMFAELHSLLSSGLDFSRSFSLLIEGERDAQTKALLTGLYRSVVRGEALARAFERSGRFAPLDCGVLRIGEQTGRLDEALAFLADYYRKRIAQRR